MHFKITVTSSYHIDLEHENSRPVDGMFGDVQLEITTTDASAADAGHLAKIVLNAARPYIIDGEKNAK